MSLKRDLENKKIVEDILENLPENLKKSFLDGYLFARFSLWDNLTIECNKNVKIEILLLKNTYQPFKDILPEFLLRRLKDFCIGLGMYFLHGPTKRRVFFNYKFYDFLEEKVLILEDKNKRILELGDKIKELSSMSECGIELLRQKLDNYKNYYFFEMETWKKESIYFQQQILNLIYSTALVLCRVKKNKEAIKINALEDSIKEEINVNRLLFEFIFKDDSKSIKDFLKNSPPFFLEIKDILLKKGLIDTDFFLKPNKTIQDVKRNLKKICKNHFLKNKCPLCGREFIKNNKSKTTCGHYNCKVLKSRLKKKMAPFVELPRDEFYKKLVEIDKKRLETNKRRGSNAQKIANLPQLADILYNELIA